jgi:hypothetical protein
VAYSTSRAGVDRQYFVEEGPSAEPGRAGQPGVELRAPLRAAPIKSVLVPGCVKLQVSAAAVQGRAH